MQFDGRSVTSRVNIKRAIATRPDKEEKETNRKENGPLTKDEALLRLYEGKAQKLN